MKYILLFVIICLSTLQGYSVSANRDSSLVPHVQNEIQITSYSTVPLSTPDLKTKRIKQDNDTDSSEKNEKTESWSNILALFVAIIGLVSSIYSIYRASKVNERNNMLTNKVKELEIKMRTSDLVVAKRLEVFPKLHILTDTLGAAIRYYKNHISDEEKKEWNTFALKREIKVFHQKLASWDANYCIYGGRELTNRIGFVRHKLLENQDWDKIEITVEKVDELYDGLLKIERQLKKEMKIHFTESEDEADDEKVTSVDF